jgi:hypothetical protein
MTPVLAFTRANRFRFRIRIKNKIKIKKLEKTLETQMRLKHLIGIDNS